MGKYRDWKKAFWSKVRKNEDGCWLWTAYCDRDGYGEFGAVSGDAAKETGGETKTHRIVFVLCNGFVPDGGLVLHRCDNPPCVNPLHLYLGTHTQNAEDRSNAGRHGIYKLTLADVTEMRRLYDTGKYTQTELSARFGVHRTHVWKIVVQRRWRKDMP